MDFCGVPYRPAEDRVFEALTLVDFQKIFTQIPKINLCLSSEFTGAMYRLGTHPMACGTPAAPGVPHADDDASDEEEEPRGEGGLQPTACVWVLHLCRRRTSCTSHHSRVRL